MPRRIAQLLVGLVVFGVGCALIIRAGLGVDPWTVLAEGLALRTGIGVGWVTVVLGAMVLLAWIPLRQRPGVGTIANVVLVGTSIQVTIALVPAAENVWVGVLMLVGGLLAVAVASGLYLGSDFGAGPRDGLMTGLHRRLRWPIWLARLLVETSVLVAGWILGGTVGVGTVVFALCIGPLVHHALPLFDLRQSGRTPRTA